MTVYTLSARPGRQDPDAGAQLQPVPWQRMLWVTWRQHRGLLISVGVVFVVMVAAMLAIGTRIHQDYGRKPHSTGPEPGGASRRRKEQVNFAPGC